MNLQLHFQVSIKIVKFAISMHIDGASNAGVDPGFQVRGGGAHLKKLRRVEGGAKIFGVFGVKHYDFTPKNHIFSNCGGRCEHFWGISCEKSRFYANFRGGGRAGCASPWIRP